MIIGLKKQKKNGELAVDTETNSLDPHQAKLDWYFPKLRKLVKLVISQLDIKMSKDVKKDSCFKKAKTNTWRSKY